MSAPRIASGTAVLTIAETSALLGLSRCSLWRHAKAGTLPSVQLSPGRVGFAAHVVAEKLGCSLDALAAMRGAK